MGTEEALPKVDSLIPLVCYMLRMTCNPGSEMLIQGIPKKYTLKGATTRFARLENLRLHFSSSLFVIRVYLPYPSPSLSLHGLLSSLWCFSI